jgi:hypothetical protein
MRRGCIVGAACGRAHGNELADSARGRGWRWRSAPPRERPGAGDGHLYSTEANMMSHHLENVLPTRAWAAHEWTVKL